MTWLYVYMYPASISLKKDFFIRHLCTADDCIPEWPRYDKITVTSYREKCILCFVMDKDVLI